MTMTLSEQITWLETEIFEIRNNIAYSTQHPEETMQVTLGEMADLWQFRVSHLTAQWEALTGAGTRGN